jgi:hypothetical protein
LPSAFTDATTLERDARRACYAARMLRKASLASVLALGLAACGGSPDPGPAWPKPQASETDGGESLEPRQASSVAAIEKAEDAKPSATEPAPASPTAAPAAAPAATPDAPAPEAPKELEDVLTTEEIVIEIEDD